MSSNATRHPKPIVRLALLVLSLGCTTLTGSPVGHADQGARLEHRLRGELNAPVTLIEYSDFTCGYCRKFFVETWPKLLEKYVETGKVRFLYRDFPRASQGPAVEAALAARCAGEQGRYWAMHDRLYGNRLDWQAFQRQASAIGLDMPRFTACFQQGRYTDDIFRDKEEGMYLGFRGTPGFVLLLTAGADKEPPLIIPGAFPFDVFEEQIDRLLKRQAQH